MYIVPAVAAVRERSAPLQSCRDTAGTGMQVQKILHPRMWAGDVQGEIDCLRPPARQVSY